MLKTAIHITIAFLMLAMTTGFSVSKHYCGEDLISVSVNSDAKSCCDDDCEGCRNEIEQLNLDQDFLESGFVLNLGSNAPVLFDLFSDSRIIEIRPVVADNNLFLQKDLPPPSCLSVLLSMQQTYLL